MAKRVVFDCMLFLQGAARPTSPAAACLELGERGHVELCLSAEVLAEIRDVLTRPKIRAKFPSLTSERVESFVNQILRTATMIVDVAARLVLPRDPKDEKYLNLAAAAGARYLVSRDRDLLDLSSGAGVEATEVRARCPGMVICNPVARTHRERWTGFCGACLPSRRLGRS